MKSAARVFLGSGAPGSQPFEVFDESFSILDTGETRLPAQASLPGTFALLVIGALALAVRRARSSL